MDGVNDAERCPPTPALDVPNDDCGDKGTLPISLLLLPGEEGSVAID